MSILIFATTISALLSSPGPKLPDGIHFGMDATVACKRLKGKPVDGKRFKSRCLVEEPGGLRMYLWADRRGKLNGLRVSSKKWFGKPHTAWEAVRAWGQSQHPGEHLDPMVREIFATAYWDNVDAGVRGRLTGYDITIEPLTSIDRILGTTGRRLAIEARQPILGHTKQELIETYQSFAARTAPARFTPTSIRMELGMTTSGTRAASLSISFRDNIAISYSIMIWVDLLDAKEADRVRNSVKKRIAAVYGKPALSLGGGSVIFPGPPIVRSRHLAEKTKGLIGFTVGNCSSDWTKHDLGNGTVLPCIP